MLTQEILTAVKGYTQSMQKPVTFVLQTGEHSKRNELKDFLSAIVSVSDNLKLEERDLPNALRSPISFLIEVEGVDTGIRFSGIPSGHEFNSLILAILQASGTPLKLDDSVTTLIAGLQDELKFEVFISLSCHNCPDVVQALNQFALLNPNISSEMIDGGLYQDEIKARDIQGVPSVYLNGELFANGKVDAAELIEKLMQRSPAPANTQETKALPLQDVTVIGGGPAGVSAAIYSARKGLKVTLIADRIGGQVKDTMDIENLISVPKTTGPQLTGALQSHLNEYDITLKEFLKVTDVQQGDIKTITLSSGETIHSKTLIIATGAKWRELGVPGEKENIGNGVAYCPHCDGPFFKGKDVAVIGGGNSGIEAALDLAGIVKSVTVFEFMPELKADQVLLNKAIEKANINILKNVATQEIKASQGKVSSIQYQDRATETRHELALDGVFVQIGLVPNSGFLGNLVEQSRFGEIVINEKCQTSESGIYACGDVTTVPYKQIVVAMGEGAKASLSSFEYLLSEGDRLQALYDHEQTDNMALAS
ncbi:alkyl hydroperoxide reductase subunit F [Aestuariirhabdus sp. Z084]|uniref:alkyl hydroperoxide reductase subunit F n=1 Tax=Aestuariirhabdus haliotis TaxID=2918751 RepID=UPI00201B3AE8|nr:alkyl hydroperoxide reductase subunit F [Aestuariirhabdus haliotis]MCL6416975.1 alkyl hydroperoxide reductase subunit F [Aestuariirhabdus haliotis]MCL6421018.1 alkyl hydroperoxide reductase subunit F [Aestuariirhabdus haliotis]